MEEGAHAKAAKHLVSEGLVDISVPAIASKLADLHPSGMPVRLGPDQVLPVRHVAEWPEVPDWDSRVAKATMAFPPGSAGGPSGLRPAHLKDCLKRTGSANVLLLGLSAFVQKASDGMLPSAIREHLCSANLIPLRKKDGGIRPIAVGETFRRLVGKVLLRLPHVQEGIESLRPRQCGVGMPFAAELVGMGVHRLASGVLDAHVNEQWVLLQVDVCNAFNSVDRSTMLQQTLRKVPAVYNWLSWTYAEPSPLFCQGVQLASSTAGVHQGDAMGPLGFALGLEAALDECMAQEQNLPWVSWYLDDGTIVGPLQAVADYLDQLVPALQKSGLQINLQKTILWGPGVQLEEDMADNIPDTISLHHPIRKARIIPYGASMGTTVLGTPCDAEGSVTHAKATWNKAVENTVRIIRRLEKLPNGQIRHCLIIHGLDACKVMVVVGGLGQTHR